MKRYIGSHKVRFFKALAAMLASFLFQVSSYFVQMQLINTVLEGNVRKLAIQMVTVLLLWLLMTLFEFFGENSMAKLVQIMNCDLRADLSRGIQKMSVSEFHKKDVGEAHRHHLRLWEPDQHAVFRYAADPYPACLPCREQTVF